MTKLSPTERQEFLKIFTEDLLAINGALAHQIESIWDKAREQIIRELGYDKLMQEKAELMKQRAELDNKIHMIEEEIASKPLTKQQQVELGGEADNWGKYKGANFYGVPITSQFDYQCVQLIKEHLDLEAPAKFVHDLNRACVRELTMSGTFEQATQVYEKFYALDFRKYGVDIPPRLESLKTEQALLQRTQQVMIDHKRTLSATCMGCGRTEEEREKAGGLWYWFKIDWRNGKGVCNDCKSNRALLENKTGRQE